MAISQIKQQLLEQRKKLLEQIRPLKALEQQLEEVDLLLSFYDNKNIVGRGGWEKEGHENGCRCYECDPSR